MRSALSRVNAQRPLLLDFLAPRALGRIHTETRNGPSTTLRFKHSSATATAQVLPKDTSLRPLLKYRPNRTLSKKSKPNPSSTPTSKQNTDNTTTTTSESSTLTTSTSTTQTPSPSNSNSLDDAHALIQILRDAASRSEVLTVLSAHDALLNTSNSHWLSLGAQNYGAISRMLLSEYSVLSRHTFRSPQESRAAEELALKCAKAGNTDGVRQMMIWHLARGGLEEVLRMFGRFEREVLMVPLVVEGEGDGTGREGGGGGGGGEEEETLRVVEDAETSGQGVSHVLMCALATYALRDDFRSALGMVLRHGEFRMSGSCVRAFERDLRSCERVLGAKEKKKVQAFEDATDAARLICRPEAFKAHLRNIASSKDVGETLEGLAWTILSGFEGPLRWAARSEEDAAKEQLVVVTEKIWSYVIYEMVCARQEDLAQEVWTRILRLGYKPTNLLWNTLLEGYRDTSQLTMLWNAWRVMKTQGVQPDAVSYTALIGCLFAQQSRGGALQLFDEYKKFKKGGDKDTLLVYNTVINGYLAERDIAGAMKLLDDMRSNGPKPDLVTFNIFIKHYAKKGDLQGIASITAQLVESGLSPDVFTFTTILNGMFKARVKDATDQLLSLMNKMGVKPSVATYSTLIDAEVRKGTRESIHAAWRLLDELEHMKDVKPNIVTYTSILTGINRSRELSKDEVHRMSRDILERISKRRLRLRLGTYHILMKSALDNPSPQGIDSFLTYYGMLKKEGIPFWHDTWYIILNGLVKRNEWKLASAMKSEMLKSQFEPMWGVLEAVKIINVWELKKIK